jgi:hypothetical protein
MIALPETGDALASARFFVLSENKRNFSIFRGCGQSPDRVTSVHGQETGPNYPKLLRRYDLLLSTESFLQKS